MSIITQHQATFTIADHVISMVDGLYSLNDCHKASGSDKKHQPAFFMRNKEVREMVVEIERSANMQNESKHKAFKSIKGGKAHKQGTYACKELVYRYAMWISPKFALTVIRAFDSLVSGKTQPQPKTGEQTTKDERRPLNNAVNMLIAKTESLNYSQAFTMVNQYMGVNHTYEIERDRLPQAIEYIHNLVLKTPPKLERIERVDPLIELLDDKKCNEISHYMDSLHKEIERLGGNQPVTPVIEGDNIIKQFATRKIQGSRMMLSVNHRNETVINLIPRNANIIHDDSIAGVISDSCVISKDKLPEIMAAVLKRASR